MAVKLNEEQRLVIVDLYADCRRVRDELPYSAEFDRMHAEFMIKTGLRLTRHDFWRKISAIGKAGELPNKKRPGRW